MKTLFTATCYIANVDQYGIKISDFLILAMKGLE